MRVCGVVCEYNPFHRGHALHLRLARALSGADYVVCVMSGALTQRGHFARHDKWTRARMALESGADLVLELPVRFACASAPDFARGGVGLLCALGVVTHLSFGCEAEALPHLSAAAHLLGEESPALRGALREGMARGLSYPQAMGETLRLCLPPEGAQACALPNAALALEYLRALPGSITPVPVAREGAGYHDEALAPLASATAVRAALERGDLPGALSADGKSYVFSTGHFSTYAVMSEEEADAAIAEQEKAEAEALAKAEAAAIAAAKPGTPSVKLSSPAKGKLTVKASAKKAKGYRVYYKKAGWKAYKTFTTTGTVKSLSKTFKKLSKGSYTVKVRAFGKTAAGKTVWGAKSKAKKVSVK